MEWNVMQCNGMKFSGTPWNTLQCNAAEYCRASHTGDVIRVMYSSVGVGVVHVLCALRMRAGAEHSVMFLWDEQEEQEKEE